MAYVLDSVVLENGERQVLINDDAGLPPLLPNLYFAQIHNQSYNTKTRRASTVVKLLNWAQDQKIDLLDRVKSGEGLEDFEQQALLIKMRYRATPTKDDLYVSADMFRDRCREILKFLSFLMRTFGNQRRERDKYIMRVQAWLYDLRDFLMSNHVRMPPYRREGFSHPERVAMLELIHPLNEKNPFQQRVRERNWLIINILFETGIRVGELLSLRCNAVVKELDIQFGMLHFLVVNQNVYLDEDPRSRPPEAKTTSRKLPISEKLAERIDQYIRNGRRFRGRAAQRAAAFLFLNSDKSPAPLSIGGLYKILSRIESVGNAAKPVFSKIQAHRFRYSMMEELLRVLKGGESDKGGKEAEENWKQVLRYMGGWSPTSNQHELYTAKQIIFSAHLALLKVHEHLMVKYDK